MLGQSLVQVCKQLQVLDEGGNKEDLEAVGYTIQLANGKRELWEGGSQAGKQGAGCMKLCCNSSGHL